MKIMERINHVGQEVKKDFDANGPLGKKLHDAAINAILGGKGSAEWAAYMSLFADSKEQLARLKAEDAFSQEQSWVPTSVAYLAGNGTCGGMTPLALPNEVNNSIDFGIDNTEPDEAVTALRPFQVPEPAAAPADQPQPTDHQG